MDNENKEYMTDVIVSGLKCLRCDHSWIPRKAGVIPLTCPHCHSAYWSRKPIRPKKVAPEVTNS